MSTTAKQQEPVQPVAAPRTSAAADAAAPTDPIDFHVFTGAIEPDASYAYTDDLMRLIGKPDLQGELAKLPKPIVPMKGSSTIRDLQGDRMTLSALEDMAQCDANMSVWLNHDYTLPDSLYGSMQNSPTITMQDSIADLAFASDVEILNHNALQTYLYSVRGRRMGVSCGVMVLGAQWVDAQTGAVVPDEDVDFWDVIAGAVLRDITHVKLVEMSVVGIPANQRSWVESGLKGLFARTYDLKLAPIVRSLWPSQYSSLLAGVADPALRQQLADVQPRHTPRPAPRIFWSPDSDAFSVEQNKQTRPVTRAQLAALLKGIVTPAPAPAASSLTVATPPTQALAHEEPTVMTTGDADAVADADARVFASPVSGSDVSASAVETPVTASDDTDALLTKGVSGKTDWPLADRDTAWSGSAADKDLREYAGLKDDGTFDHAQYASGHFWYDSEHADNLTAYKLPFVAKDGDTLKAIPRGIFAVAGSLSGARGGTTIPEADQAKIKSRVAGYYARMRKQFDDDTLVVPWADEKSLTDAGLIIVKAAEGSDGGDGGDVAVSADGKHAPYTGSHLHTHKAMGAQGDDNTHKHTHSHDGDANHNHPADHPDTKAVDPDVATAFAAPIASAAPAAAPVDGAPEPETLIASATPETPAADLAPAAVAEGAADLAPLPAATLDPARATLIKTYSEMLAPLGLRVLDTRSEQVADKIACNLVASDAAAQEVITLVSQLDTMTDAFCTALRTVSPYTLENTVDRLMDVLNIPDVDDDDDDDDDDDEGAEGESSGDNAPGSAGPAAMPYGGPTYGRMSADLTRISQRMATLSVGMLGMLHKAGKRHSAADREALQTIHESVVALTDGMCCKDSDTSAGDDDLPTGQDDTPASGTANNRDMQQARTGMATGKGVAALEGNVSLLQDGKALLDALTTSYTAAAQAITDTTALTSQVQALRDDLAALTTEKEALAEALDRIGATPLGRPTRAQKSSGATPATAAPNVADPTTVTQAQATALLTGEPVEAPSRAMLFAQTSKEYQPGVGNVRVWPDGVGKGMRPALTDAQVDTLNYIPNGDAIRASYHAGGPARIPIITDED